MNPQQDWLETDFYAVLGVRTDASSDEIARAFRTAAKTAHPDATDDPVATERFQELVDAYSVLSDRRTRRDYDRVRAGISVRRSGAVGGPQPGPVAATPFVRSRARAWVALVAGAVVLLGGLLVAGATWQLSRSEAAEQAGTVAVTAERISGGRIVFLDGAGRRVIVTEPAREGDPRGSGPTVRVRYDPADPERVFVATSSVGRDLTLAVVAAKLLIGGAVFVVVGGRTLVRTAR